MDQNIHPILNINQSPEELNKVHKDDYYWYLRDKAFVPFHQVIADCCLQFSVAWGSVLDVGCGEGYVADYLGDGLYYHGIDGSEEAITKAIELRSKPVAVTFDVARFEDYPSESIVDKFSVVIFGNILEVLIKREQHICFIQKYVDKFSPSHFIVYEMEHFNSSHIDAVYSRVFEYHGKANIKLEPEVKKHRKVLVYKCG